MGRDSSLSFDLQPRCSYLCWENELSATIELSSTKGQNSRLPKTEVLGGTELSSTTELSTTMGGQNFRLSLNSCLPKMHRTFVYFNILRGRRELSAW